MCGVCVCRNIQCTILSSDLTFLLLLQVKVWLKWLKMSLFKGRLLNRGRNFNYNSEVWLRRRPIGVEVDVRVHLKHLKHLLGSLKVWAPFVGVWWHQCSKRGSLTLEFVVVVLQSRVHTNFSIRWSKTAQKIVIDKNTFTSCKTTSSSTIEDAVKLWLQWTIETKFHHTYMFF